MFAPHELSSKLEDQEGIESNDDQPTMEQEFSQSVADNPSKRLRVDLESDLEATMPHGNPGTSQNNEKIKTTDLKSAQIEEFHDHFVPLNSLPSAQAAFSIPKIRDKIVSYLRPQELLQFRLVSRYWRVYATNEKLLNWEENKIRIAMSVGTCFQRITIVGFKKFEEPMQELTELLNGTGSSTFPCSHFWITYSNWESERDEIKDFVRNHGSRIQKLTLELCYVGSCEGFLYTDQLCSHQENWILQVLSTVFLHQAPNLEEIQVLFRKFGPEQTICNTIANNFSIESVPSPGTVLTKLRSASLSDNVPKSVFDLICELAPNLTDFKCDHVNFYLDPINRLHLVKNLEYFICTTNPNPQKDIFMEQIVNTESKLQLDSLDIGTISTFDRPQDLINIVDIFNKLLEKSCHCLKKLQLSPSGFLPGLKIPRMPNVETLSFFSFPPADTQTHFLPQGVRLSETFPKLRYLQFCLSVGLQKSQCANDDFFHLCSEKEVVVSVREIKVFWNPTILDKIQRWFPNAKIVQTYFKQSFTNRRVPR